jgi:hypothetical protein
MDHWGDFPTPKDPVEREYPVDGTLKRAELRSTDTRLDPGESVDTA